MKMKEAKGKNIAVSGLWAIWVEWVLGGKISAYGNLLTGRSL